uniref:NB-ARC domain-containing protein n=1 Tax=Oryza glumipatula TaxID=40148 RepID=A0A0D9ZV91_9ORYZ
MAEGIVFSVICKIGSILGNNVAQTLSAQLGKEVTIIVEIERHARMIECELKMMRSFLHDAQGKTRYNKQTVTYLQEVQRLVFEIEDILDEFANLFGKYQAESDKLFKCFRKPSVSCWHNIANNLKDVQIRLDNFRDMKLQYDISFVENTLPREDEEQFRLLFPYQMDTNNIVGMSMLKQQLEECLLTGEKSMKVIGISGLGGSGKSSLAKAIYEAKRIKEYFDLRVWIKVPIRCQLENILRMIIQGAVKETGPMDLCNKGIEDLVCIIQRTFCQRRFLIVSDDVWDMKYFEYLINVLGETRSGSRVLSTSRKHGSHHVSFHCFIRGLNEEDSWNLFRTWAFKNMVDESFVGEVEGLARQILSRCHGLPLAIMAVSSLLSYKGSVREWEIFCDRLNWELDDDVCMFTGLDWAGRMISLIYHHLPKDCFMTRKRLIRLWVAEGLIEPSGSRTLEDTAEDYLNGLISWCLLNVVETNVFGRVKQCEMHGFMRDIALSESHKDKFCKVYENSTGRTSDGEFRRISIHEYDDQLQLSMHIRHLRSLYQFDVSVDMPIISLLKSAKYLRVLDLQGCSVTDLPEFLAKFFNLHYLGLRGTDVQKLPRSIGRLKNLQTLDITSTKIRKLPVAIISLRKLRHLIMGKRVGLYPRVVDRWDAVEIPDGPWELLELQTLKIISASIVLVQQLGKMAQLRTLRIGNVKRMHCEPLFSSIDSMHFLRKLEVLSDPGDFIDLGALTCPSHHLEKLLLNGRLQDIMLESPLLKQTANSLKLLSLENSMLNADPLPQFSCSCNLVALTLSNAFAGKQLHFRDGWFPMLQQLDLSDLCNVELITIEEHSIKKLSELSLSKMTGLKEEFMKNIEGAAGAELQGVALVRYFDQAEQSMKVDCRDKLKEEESEETCHGNYTYGDLGVKRFGTKGRFFEILILVSQAGGPVAYLILKTS